MRDRALVFVLGWTGAEPAKLAERPPRERKTTVKVRSVIGRDMRTGTNSSMSSGSLRREHQGSLARSQRQAWVCVSAESPECDVPWGIAPSERQYRADDAQRWTAVD
jgi:hypothetical protein